MASENVVQVVINGRDNSSAAFRSATASSQRLSTEMRGMGQVMNATGNIAQVLGNTAFSTLTNQANMLAMAGKELISTFSKVNIVKASLVGLALVGGAMLINKVMEQKEAEEKRNEATKEAIQLNRELYIQGIATINQKQAAYLREDQQHARNKERIQELSQLGAETADLEKQELLRNEAFKFQIREQAIEKQRQDLDREKRQRMAMNQTITRGTSDMFGNLATAAQAFGKKGFKAFKVFATAKAIVDTYAAANGAYSAMSSIPYVGPALGAAAAVAAIAAGMANVAAIQSQSAGQAHAGMDYVPREGSYILQQGEAVLDPGTSEQMRNGALGGAATHVTVQIDGDTLFRAMGRASRDGRLNISARGVV